MENVSTVTSANFVLLGIVEMGRFNYLYGILSLFVYVFIMLLSFEISFVILTEETLHEPMYIFICNLVFNGMLGSTSFFPKMIINLLTLTSLISHVGCLLQVLSVMTYTLFEVSSFTITAYDRYLAVCHPLRYAIIMTNEKAVKIILGFFFFCFTSVLIAVVLSSRLSFCGKHIRNVYCDNLSLIVLSCTDYSVNNLYGSIVTMIFLVFTLLIIAFSYLKIFLICLKISKEARDKAVHTVVTHLLNFSIFLIGGLFIFVRFRLGNDNLPLFVHILLSVTLVVFPPFFNPLIYGIRTRALGLKIFHHLHNIQFL